MISSLPSRRSRVASRVIARPLPATNRIDTAAIDRLICAVSERVTERSRLRRK